MKQRNRLKRDFSAASLQPKETETEKKISSPPAQKNEQNYAHNSKVRPFIAPVAQEPTQSAQRQAPQPVPQQYATSQPAQQQYMSPQRHDALHTYGEQRAQPRTYQEAQYTHPQHVHPQAQHANHHYGQNSMDYSRQPHHPNAAPTYVKPSIVSEPTMNSTESAFSKLTQAFQFAHNEKKQAEAQSAVYGTSAIESFVIEMARPMIREWIDQHLPKLVDKLVTQEIEKLTEDLRKKLL